MSHWAGKIIDKTSLYFIFHFVWGLFVSIHPQISNGQSVTFSEHIAPIIFENCTPCHRPGQSGPFSLITFRDVAKRANLIRHVTESRFMPPWFADREYRSFKNEKGLSEAEIQLIGDWVEQGTPRGPTELTPPIPQFPNGSQIGIPDLVLPVQQAYQIPGDNSEQFILFVIPFELDKMRSIQAIEFVSDNSPKVHHANFGFYEVGSEVSIQGDVAPISSENMMNKAQRFRELSQNLLFYNGWIPGSSPITFPAGTGFNMPKRGVIMLTIHYAPSSLPDRDSSRINIFFGEEEANRSIQTLNIGSAGIGEIVPPLIIPANQISQHRVQIKIKRPLSLLYAWPHMHLVGNSFKAYAVHPDGDTIPLVKINKWDFNWQEAYQFDRWVVLPAGSIITVEGSFDNTAENPNNPNDPPKTIYSDGLMETKNEMLSLILIYMDFQAGDEKIRLDGD